MSGGTPCYQHDSYQPGCSDCWPDGGAPSGPTIEQDADVVPCRVVLEPADISGWTVGTTRVRCRRHPEWGTFGIVDRHDGYFDIRGERGERVLFDDEAREHWEVAP